MNPYGGQDFFEFFAVFFSRLYAFVTGNLSFYELASDEIQMGVLSLVAASCSLIGSFLVLKKMTMLANSLSHTILLGIVVSLLLVRGSLEDLEAMSLTHLFVASILAALLTSVLTQWMTQVMRLQEDASIGLVFTTLFAFSVVLVTAFTRSTHLGVEAIMGHSDALHLHNLKLAGVVLLVDLVVMIVFFKEFVITTFDKGLTQSLGFSPTLMNHLLMVLTAGTVVAAFRAVGVLLVLALIVGPVLTARLLTHRLKTLIVASMGIGSLAAIMGVATSRHMLTVYNAPLSTAGLVVCMIGLFYLLTLVSVSLRSKTRVAAQKL